MSEEPSRSVTKKCVTCGKKFKANRSDAKYCTQACRQSAHRARAELDDLDREIEEARLHYWELIAKKAKALGRVKTQALGEESVYLDMNGQVWMGGVLGGGEWRLAGNLKEKGNWDVWGLDAAGPPWAPPSPAPDQSGHYEKSILGEKKKESK